MHRTLIASVVLWLAISRSALAQGQADLVVTLKDIDSRPVAGAMVIIRSAGGDRDITSTATDIQGIATFSGLTETDIRVAVQGQLPGDGVRFFQPGNDAKGIVMFLQPGTNRMNLLADTDGMISPDPLTMSALEPGILVATEVPNAESTPFPTLPIAQPRPTATAIAAVIQPTFGGAAAPATEEPAPATNPVIIWLGIALLVILVFAGISIIILQRRWR